MEVLTKPSLASLYFSQYRPPARALTYLTGIDLYPTGSITTDD